MKEVKIKNLVEIADESYLLSFSKDFEFTPGQVIGINIGNEQPARLYSIASGNKESDIQILFTLKDDGYLTPRLAKAKPGDTILVSEAFGNFICNEKEAFWIASGTGIAPFASMMNSGLHEGKTLIHGSRYLSHFYFREQMQKKLGKNYIPCCSAESDETIYKGRLTQYLNDRNDLPLNSKYYLCGSAEMVVDTRDILIGKNIPYENIIAEIYF